MTPIGQGSVFAPAPCDVYVSCDGVVWRVLSCDDGMLRVHALACRRILTTPLTRFLAQVDRWYSGATYRV